MTRVDALIAELCPDGVEHVELRDVGVWYGGGTPPKAVRAYWENGSVPWLSPKDMASGTILRTADHISDEAVGASTVKLVPAGSVAFVVRSNILRRRLPVALVPMEVTMNQDMRAVVPRDGILVDYLAQVCRARAAAILAAAGRTDGSMAAIRGRQLLDFRVPVPPLPIQHEIAAILGKMESLEAALAAELEARRHEYAHYRDLLLSFQGGTEVRRAPMGEVGDFIRGRRFTKDDVVEAGLASIHYGEIYTRYGVAADRALSHVRAALAPTLRFAKTGDVVIAAVGETVEDVGKAVAWLGEDDVAIHDDCFAYRHTMSSKFVAYYLQTKTFHAEKAKHVARAKVKRISKAGLARVRIPVPSEAEQQRIVDMLDAFDALVNDTSIGLPAEISARHRQYEHYRDRLLTFDQAAA